MDLISGTSRSLLAKVANNENNSKKKREFSKKMEKFEDYRFYNFLSVIEKCGLFDLKEEICFFGEIFEIFLGELNDPNLLFPAHFFFTENSIYFSSHFSSKTKIIKIFWKDLINLKRKTIFSQQEAQTDYFLLKYRVYGMESEFDNLSVLMKEKNCQIFERFFEKKYFI